LHRLFNESVDVVRRVDTGTLFHGVAAATEKAPAASVTSPRPASRTKCEWCDAPACLWCRMVLPSWIVLQVSA